MNNVEREFDKAPDAQNHTILIIDDEPANLAVVADYLAQSGFQIKVTQTGEAGLELARRTPPDLILLDVRLPGVDGFEVCRRLKTDERTRQIPVIFMTVLIRVEDKVKGFEVGGMDYISKPFQKEEVLARVATHLRLRDLTLALEEANKGLELRVAERTVELSQANARLEEEIAERKHAEMALQRMNRELRAIRSCNQMLMRAMDEQTLLDNICHIVCEEAGYRLAWVGYVERDEAKTVRPVAWGGFDGEYVADAKLSWADGAERAQGPGGTAIRSGEIVYIQDFTTDPRMAPWRESALQRGYRSAIGLPLKDEKANVFGVLLIYSLEVNSFSLAEIRLLEELAGDLAFGICALRTRIERKRAGDEIRKLNQELEQRVVERTTQLEAANKELEAFAYSVSHDLRSPLRHIGGFLELLRTRAATTLDEESLHFMEIIADSTKRMGVLIDDLLSFSRMGRNGVSKSQIDLGELVQDVIREFEPETEGRDILWQISPLPEITGDRAMLRMVLVNLISNALKFTRSRTSAKIEIGWIPGSNAERIIFIRDNGVGFDMQYADKLFGVFQRLHSTDEFEGTGIGLSNVRRIINRHGGRTWAEAEVNHGATFYFSLPQPNQQGA